MKILFICLAVLATGCTLRSREVANSATTSPYQMSAERVDADRRGPSIFRTENNEVICYAGWKSIWCMKK